MLPHANQPIGLFMAKAKKKVQKRIKTTSANCTSLMSGGFHDLGLLPELLHAIDDLGWSLPTDIQDEAIPLMLGGGDVMGAAETGSGKTAAFALPVIQGVYERLKVVYDKQQQQQQQQQQREQQTRPSMTTDNKKRKMSGTPPLATATTAAAVVIQLNADDRDVDLSITNSGLSCAHTAPAGQSPAQWVGVRATHGVRCGLGYFEVLVRGHGNCRVGWSTLAAQLEVGRDAQGFGYGAKGFKSFNGHYDPYGTEFTAGDVIGCFLNLTERQEVFFAKNGQLLGQAFTIPASLHGSVFFPAVALSNSAADLNFGASPFVRAPLPGYGSLTNRRLGETLFDTDSVECYMREGFFRRSPLALIVLPTRDLAEQVVQSILDLSKYVDEPCLRTLLLIGDNNSNGNEKSVKAQLQAGVDIVVGTIGKLVAFSQSGLLDLSQIRFLVLDEADKLTSADNIDDIKHILGKCPGGGTGCNRLQVSDMLFVCV
jgi:ATP-dependent RNA helicase DDX1